MSPSQHSSADSGRTERPSQPSQQSGDRSSEPSGKRGPRRPPEPPGAAPAGFVSGFVAIVGRPNVGKSTLLNRVLGEKLAIVSPRPQTTRERLLGVAHLPGAQLALVDTPGLHRPGGRGRTLLNRFMVDEALTALSSVDAVLLVTDLRASHPSGKVEQELRDRIEHTSSPPAPGKRRAAPPRPAESAESVGEAAGKRAPSPPSPSSLIDPADRFVVQELLRANKPVVLAINKVDLVRDKALILPLIAEWSSLAPFRAVVPISAETGEGVEHLLAELKATLPAGAPLFDSETLTDRSERYLVAERVREQVFQRLRQELPYAVAVTIDSWEERTAAESRRGGKRAGDRIGCAIDATIHVEKDNQKKILVGHGGQMIRDIGSSARKEIGELLGCPVHLALFVRVDEEWSTRPNALREMGYDLSSDAARLGQGQQARRRGPDARGGPGSEKRRETRPGPGRPKPGPARGGKPAPKPTHNPAHNKDRERSS
jgi:GTP-binding protein Era